MVQMSLKEKLENRLKGSKFRLINEKLYKKSYKTITKSHIKLYHEAFAAQTKKWSTNPIEKIYSMLFTKNNLKIADLGCGDAFLHENLKSHTVYSFDLFPTKDYIVKCDISSVPMDNGSVDVCVLCLSMMTRDVFDYVREANRLCVVGGYVYVAEIRSRFENVGVFVRQVCTVGFEKVKVDDEDSYFIFFVFKKVRDYDSVEVVDINLKMWNYKKR